MARIKPFKGVLYNPRIVGGLSKVTTPPYDVISLKMQEEYYRAHQNNVIRLILGRVKPKDNKADNRYKRAEKFLKDWLEKGILTQDKDPSLYVYEQDYFFNGGLKRRLGFIALMKIEDPHKSCVLPHEYTFSKPKRDRFDLLKATGANLSPIFSLFEDRGQRITGILKDNMDDKPIIDIEQNGVTHRLWRMTKTDKIEEIKNLMKRKQVFIADGHHRYEVALNFRDWMRRGKKSPSEERDYDYVMVYFSNLDPEALTILSTHRVIRSIKRFDFQKVLSKFKEFFHIERLKDKGEMFARIENAEKGEFIFGMYHKAKGFFSLALKKETMLDDVIPQDKAYSWKWLDVTILHRLVFDHILKVKERVAKRENIVYTRDADYALHLVDRGGYEISFFLNPPRLEQLKEMARSRHRMPHKTTYFYPKPLSGLVFYKMK